MAVDTTAPSYWLNWRFLLSAIWILVAMVFGALLIWRNEGNNKSRSQPNGEHGRAKGCLYKGEAWGTCSQSIHPIWLLAFRIVAFCSMLALILAQAVIHSVFIFYFYTQWTFTLVTIYFGLGSSLSVYGCLSRCHSEKDQFVGTDAERGSYVAPRINGENADTHSMNKSLDHYDGPNRKAASGWEYALQIIFQMCVGAVVLTDSVFWIVLYPIYLSDNSNYKLGFLNVCMHSVNAIFLLGDAILNGLHFPFFRIAYFFLWTCVFVIFQWIIHVCVSWRWPYPFLDLSSPYAPLWYLGVGLLHFPCFGIFDLILKIKQHCLSR